MRIFLTFWSLLWLAGLPLVLLYLRKRAKGDALYGEHLAERFGRYSQRMQDTIWVHAVSLGEVKSASPLIQALRARGEKVVISCMTPTARREALRAYGPDIAAGEMAVVWVPFDLRFCQMGFHRAFAPRLALVIEIEIWPRLVQTARDRNVPIFMTNALYPKRAFIRDRGLAPRVGIMRRFTGALVKSTLHAERFAEVGVPNITVTGELRFDQRPPQALIDQGLALRGPLGAGRRILTLGPFPAEEEELILDTVEQLLQGDKPLILLVPRAPERFDALAEQLAARGLNFARRSTLLDDKLRLRPDMALPDILLGDSMGEMAAYLALADRVLIGGGFCPKGSHNIIEPLMLEKPTLVGPNMANSEYPVVEAMAAGICRLTRPETLAHDLTQAGWPDPPPAAISAFLAEHAGATERTIRALDPYLSAQRTTA